MYTYIMKWAEIYVRRPQIRKLIPKFCYHYVSWMARLSSQRRLRCTFPCVERAVARLAPRPWFAIHGERDTYIGPGIARTLFKRAKAPKDLWIVAGAKHNRCREKEPEAYAARLLDFMDRFAPRRLPVAPSRQPAATDPARSARSIPIARESVADVKTDPVTSEVAGQYSS
jgi:hypothetical protein